MSPVPHTRRADPRLIAILLESHILRSRAFELFTIANIVFWLAFAIAAGI